MISLPEPPPVVVVTGAMAAGKSTVAQGLAERLPRAAHVRGDVFRRFVVSGRAEPEPPLSDEATAQLHLRHDLAARVADTYAEAGFVAVVQDILLGDDLARFLERLTTRPRYAVVLVPSPEALTERDVARDKTGYGGWDPTDFAELARATPLGLQVDTTGWSVERTVEHVLGHLADAEVT
ncbi:putative phosphotransferase [Beutenbergia cavernae DSM 12333]|uniref:Putative phosphotransferase n=1 Tax=Beutenbergia cavernae (strain ATCC BAA-8 / DSM 12333 / CCUG 43141 / JCM 11478 / NBRC 16432 / NCIMB 13614 / HKI 0122) TaxID=471853 RepID=C5BVS7_BEUC1|nr:AAA family ATPase [Beutenbergia cavernae]ACQ78517.1 putative phosphotransferase [Beutenbergia cavernae DSM 12333]